MILLNLLLDNRDNILLLTSIFHKQTGKISRVKEMIAKVLTYNLFICDPNEHYSYISNSQCLFNSQKPCDYQ